MPLEEIYKHLLIHGPFGLFCAIFLYGFIVKDKALTTAQKECLAEQQKMMASHHAEMTSCQDKYVENLSTLAEKYQERAESLQDLVDLLTPRKGRQ